MKLTGSLENVDLHPESLLELLRWLENKYARSTEMAHITYRLARLFEQRCLDLEHQRCEVDALLRQLYDVEQLYGKVDSHA